MTTAPRGAGESGQEAGKLYDQPGDVRIDDIKDYIDSLLEREKLRQEKQKREREADQRKELGLANERAEAARHLAGERARSEDKERGLRQRAEGSARRARQGLWVALAASILVLFVAGYAFQQKSVADKQRTLAEQEKTLAEEQTAAALKNEARALSALSLKASADGRPNQAAQLALAAWPRTDSDKRPRLEVTLQGLSKALADGRLFLRQWKHDGPVVGARLINDEKRILSWSKDGTAYAFGAWRRACRLVSAMNHDGPVSGVLPLRDGTRILSWSLDHTLRLWAAATGLQIGSAMKHDGPVLGAVLTKNDRRIIAWSGGERSDHSEIRIWDVTTGPAGRPGYDTRWSALGSLTVR